MLVSSFRLSFSSCVNVANVSSESVGGSQQERRRAATTGCSDHATQRTVVRRASGMREEGRAYEWWCVVRAVAIVPLAPAVPLVIADVRVGCEPS